MGRRKWPPAAAHLQWLVITESKCEALVPSKFCKLILYLGCLLSKIFYSSSVNIHHYILFYIVLIRLCLPIRVLASHRESLWKPHGKPQTSAIQSIIPDKEGQSIHLYPQPSSLDMVACMQGDVVSTIYHQSIIYLITKVEVYIIPQPSLLAFLIPYHTH